MDNYYSELDAIKRAGLEHANACIANGQTAPLEFPFSGEWAGGLTGQDALDYAGIHAVYADLSDFEQVDVTDAFTDGYMSASWPDPDYGSWVDVAFLQDDDYDDMVTECGDNIDATAAYLSQWDYGTETDEAHTVDAYPWGNADDVHDVTVGGVAYMLTVNRGLRYASLNRRPIGY
jgi:hypothetical protein